VRVGDLGENGPVTFTIRLAAPSEYAMIGELTLAAYVAEGLSSVESDYVDTLVDVASRAEKAELWVAVDDGEQIVGSVTFCPPGSPYREIAEEGEGEFRMLAVAPTARGQGIGETLCRWCLARSRELGDRRMVLCTQKENVKAHRLYGRLGFVRLPERDWSPVAGVDLVAFVLDL
jgi:ribosomal protein S18 acetylase RimI-like enzyme